MSAEIIAKFDQLHSQFENQIAIYAESYLLLLVRVHGIELDLEHQQIKAGVDCSPLMYSQGCPGSQWSISIGYTTWFSPYVWHSGLNLWRIYFEEHLVQSTIQFLERIPETVTPEERYQKLQRYLSIHEWVVGTPKQTIFPNPYRQT